MSFFIHPLRESNSQNIELLKKREQK